MLNDIFNQEIRLVKNGHVVIDKIKASVQQCVYIKDISIPIEKGDLLEYIAPSGLIKKLVVKKVKIYNIGSRMDHCEIEYED